MEKIYCVQLLVLFFQVFFLCNIVSTEYIPVYKWENVKFSNVVPALTRLNQDSFRNILLEDTKHSPIIVFAEENLSPEDFILHDEDGVTLSHLSSLKNLVKVNYWPFVKNPIKAVKDLPDRTITQTSIKSIFDNPNFALHDDTVLIINLNDADENEDRLQMLKRHDDVINEIYRRFSKHHKNVIALFTGYHSSWIISEELRSHRKIRDAGDVVAKAEGGEPEGTSVIYSNKDILIYVTSAPTLSHKGESIPLDSYKVTTTSRTDENMNITLESDTNKDITVTFDFVFGTGYYILSGIRVHNEKVDPKDYSLWVKDVYAPEGFSYHCSSQSFSEFKDRTINLTLPGLQMEVYFTNEEQPNHVFGDAYDCVGFTSVPIWSGLFVTFILVIIMTFGLTMMMDIKTMDRFDDPKGKTITVNVTE